MRIKHMANIITGCRILGSIILLFFPAFSSWFYILYLLCGFTDMIDGSIALCVRIDVSERKKFLW